MYFRTLCNKDLVQSAVVTTCGCFPGVWAEAQKAGAAEGEAASPGLAAISVLTLLCLDVLALCAQA